MILYGKSSTAPQGCRVSHLAVSKRHVTNQAHFHGSGDSTQRMSRTYPETPWLHHDSSLVYED